ncbi:MAG: PPC domain-containing protein [Pirellulales bacterium]
MRILAVLACVASSLICNAAVAAEPSLGAISPFGAQRGKEVDVTFSGARLGDAQQILIYEPGIEVKSLAAEGDNAVKVKLAIAADCPVGLYGMRVRTATGISDLKLFSVGALPEVQETEPNSEFEAPQQIGMDVTVNGVVENEDVDYFVVDAKAGERITAEIEGLRLGYTFFDPYIAILDEARFELVNSDDATLVRQDGVCSVVAPKDGKYIVQVRESSFGGSGDCRYRLHVGRFPRPTAVIPAGGKAGTTVDVRWLGDVLGERTEKVTLPTAMSREFAIFASDEHGISPSGNSFRFSTLDNAVEAEPNDAANQATPFVAPLAVHGAIEKAGDVDHFKFAGKKGQVFDVRVFARQLRSPLDSVLQVIRASNGQGIGGNDDSGSPDSYLRVTLPEDDEYLVVIRDHLGKGGVDYAYRIEVAPVEPTLTMGLPERQQYVAHTLSVPQGNRMALLVSASRADWGGDLNVSFAGLPAGMTAETLPMTANRTFVPVLFTAAESAAPAGTLADVVGKPVDENLKFDGHLLQRSQLVRGQNNVDVYGHWAERMAAAVTAPAPFKIEIVQPKAPLVRDGQMSLKIVATRAEGFKAPISVFFLYNPPGVGSSGSISIAEGQNEADIPLTANGGAEIGEHKIVVIGRAGVGNGAIEVSSQLATLSIAAPFVGFAYQKASVEQGQEVDVVVAVTKNADFAGEATVELLGLPAGVSAEPLKLTKDTAQLAFKVKTSKDSPAGKHKSVLARATIVEQGEPVIHMLYGGELRIDVPLPPKPDQPAAAPTPAATAQAKPADAPAEKPLSPLEKLRQEREKAKAAIK